jgi:CRISPR/Cas system-associated exonuclease Cas4 (RecB family)
MAENDELLESGIEPDAGVILDDEPEVAKPQLVHSWTRINVFQHCPYQYKAIYLLKKKGEVNPLMIVGRVTHQAIANYNKHCLRIGADSDFGSWEQCSWDAIKESNLPAELNQEVLDMVKAYAQSHTVPQESVVGAEEEIAINRAGEQVDWLAKDVWVRVIIDLLQIQGNICKITDYKAGYAMKSDPFQLMIYAWVVKKLYPQVTDFQIELDFVRHEWQKLYTFSETDIDHIEKSVLAKIENIEKEEKFDPTIGVQCAYCPVWYCCPAMKAGDVTKWTLPKEEPEAIQLALEYEKYSRLASEAKKVLKEYCDTKGDLLAGGRRYGFNVSKKFEFDIKELFVELDQKGIDLLEYLTLDYRKFKTLLYREDILKLAKGIGQSKMSVSFTAKKADAKEEVNE